MHDPTVGRLIERDPKGLTSRSVNLYRYVGGNPPSAVDPSGLAELKTEDLMANLKKCDGGTGMYEKAMKANGGKASTIRLGEAKSGFGASVNLKTGTITIGKDTDKCEATATLFFELANLWQKDAFDKVDANAAAGKLGQEAYAEANEQVEFESVLWSLRAIRRCREQWDCKEYKFCFEPAAKARDFGDYYRNYLAQSHKDYYRKIWKEDYEAAFNKLNSTKN